MAVSSFFLIQFKSSLQDAKMWLFLGAANLALWHGVLNNRVGNNDIITTSFFWLVALFLLWKKRDSIKFSNKLLPKIIGFLLLGWVLYRGVFVFWFENYLIQLLPLPSLLALALISSGWGGLKSYFRPFLALFAYSLLGSLFELFLKSHPAGFNIAILTAQVSSFVLHYLGFDVMQREVYIALINNGVGVEVIYYCTGGPLIALMLQLSLALILIVPFSWRLIGALLFYVFGMGFLLGCIRVIILATLVGEPAFHYWHGPQGNQIFSLIAFAVWMVAVNFIYDYHQNKVSVSSADAENLEKEGVAESSSMRTISMSSPRSWLMPLASFLVATVTMITLVFSEVGRREIQPIRFPSQLSLSGWNKENSASLVDQKEETETLLRLDQIRSGKQYRYESGGSQITVNLRFLSPTFGDVEGYVKNTYDQSLHSAYKRGKTIQDRDLGYYRLFRDEKRAYLSACLTSQGESTVTVAGYRSKVNGDVFDGSDFLPRLLGWESLRERGCLWVHLSTPLEKSPDRSYRRLESAFQAGYSQWQGLFKMYNSPDISSLPGF